ncbi:uncharacterized protein LOC110403618 isoform X2 [Numida meleagris]|nr:uncharacterized protein LOC110403618 isoform X2 [Numida meleagris]
MDAIGTLFPSSQTRSQSGFSCWAPRFIHNIVACCYFCSKSPLSPNRIILLRPSSFTLCPKPIFGTEAQGALPSAIPRHSATEAYSHWGTVTLFTVETLSPWEEGGAPCPCVDVPALEDDPMTRAEEKRSSAVRHNRKACGAAVCRDDTCSAAAGVE